VASSKIMDLSEPNDSETFLRNVDICGTSEKRPVEAADL